MKPNFFFSFDCTGKLLYSCLFVRATFHRVLHSQEMQAGERRSTRKGRATAPRRMYTDTATKKKRLRGVNLFSGDVDIYGLTPLRGPPFFFPFGFAFMTRRSPLMRQRCFVHHDRPCSKILLSAMQAWKDNLLGQAAGETKREVIFFFCRC